MDQPWPPPEWGCELLEAGPVMSGRLLLASAGGSPWREWRRSLSRQTVEASHLVVLNPMCRVVLSMALIEVLRLRPML